MGKVLPADELGKRFGERRVADVVEVVERVGPPDHRLGNIPHRYAAGGMALFVAGMGVPVDREVRARPVDRLGEQVAAQKRVDLQPFALERFRYRRVVQQRDLQIANQTLERRFQHRGALFRVADEGLHFRFAEIARAGAHEPAAEPFDAGYADARSVDVDGRPVSFEQAYAEMRTIYAALEREVPQRNANRTVMLFGLHEQMTGELEPAMLALVAAAALVLLVACVNVANLLLARSAARERELAMRTALGARRGRLIRQMLAESLLLAVAGGAGGLGIAALCHRGLLALVGERIPIPRLEQISLDTQVVVITLLVAVTSVLIGDAIVSKEPVPVGDRFVTLLERHGFALRKRWVRELQATRRAFNVKNSRISHEHVLLLEKAPGRRRTSEAA